MKTIQLAPTLILLASSAHARVLQDANDTITTDGDAELRVTTVAPTDTAAEEDVAQTESSPTDAAVTGTNATDGGLFSGVGDWVGNTANTVTGTVANATDGFTDWISNVVNPNDETEEAEVKEEAIDESAEDMGEKDETPDSAVTNLITGAVLAVSSVTTFALL